MKTILAVFITVILAFSGSSAAFAANHVTLQHFDITKLVVLAGDEPAPAPQPAPSPEPSPSPEPGEPK